MKGSLNMKKLLLFVALILAIVMLVPTMISCNGDENEVETTVESTEAVIEETEPPKPEPIKLTDGSKPLFTIVRPDESDSVFDLTKKLAEMLKSATGVDFKNTTDFIGWNTVRDPRLTRSFSALPIMTRPSRS